MHVTVLIATYQRPDFLERGLRALVHQTRPPDSIVVVTRSTDLPSHQVLARFDLGGIPLRHGQVTSAGHLPPLIAGRRLLPPACDVVVQLDDDLIPHPEAIEHAVRRFADPDVGLVAGRTVEHDEGRPRPAPRRSGGGEVTFSGRIRAAHANQPPVLAAHETQWATGAIAAYRREAFDRVEIRPRLNLNVAIGYEIDWGLQIGAMGYRVLFEPRFAGDHHNAPRGHGTRRDATLAPTAIYARNHNYTYVMLHHLRGARRLAYLVRHFVIGDRWDWGVGTALYATVVERSTRWRATLPHAYRGKLDGARAYLDERSGRGRRGAAAA